MDEYSGLREPMILEQWLLSPAGRRERPLCRPRLDAIGEPAQRAAHLLADDHAPTALAIGDRTGLDTGARPRLVRELGGCLLHRQIDDVSVHNGLLLPSFKRNGTHGRPTARGMADQRQGYQCDSGRNRWPMRRLRSAD
jgi:hypothetical protein